MRETDPEDGGHAALRGEPTPNVDNLLRWERIKLRDASQEAVRLLESAAQPTREYLDYMFTTDAGLSEVRERIALHRQRIAELEAMREAAALKL